MSDTAKLIAAATKTLLEAFEGAMDAEGVDHRTRYRVINRLLWGHRYGDPQAQVTRKDVETQ